mmetsp:Transcript_35959/g.88484  ORF Transcript_35959/g.88484 Transcript_35959/m.88484 type:complete len:221 (-) Transcript_35959:1716-2378(-)
MHLAPRRPQLLLLGALARSARSALALRALEPLRLDLELRGGVAAHAVEVRLERLELLLLDEDVVLELRLGALRLREVLLLLRALAPELRVLLRELLHGALLLWCERLLEAALQLVLQPRDRVLQVLDVSLKGLQLVLQAPALLSLHLHPLPLPLHLARVRPGPVLRALHLDGELALLAHQPRVGGVELPLLLVQLLHLPLLLPHRLLLHPHRLIKLNLRC